MAKEINYYAQLRPTGVDNSAAKRLQAIAGLADQVQSIAYQAGAERAQREGKREGLTAGQAAAVEGQPLEKREGILSAFSIKDNSYNDAMESAYLSQVSVDSQEQMARIAAQYPDDVEAYSKAAAQVRAGITSSIDPNYQGIVGATLDNVIQSYETKVFGNQAAKARTTAKSSRLSNIETLGNNAANFARDGDVLQSNAAVLEASTLLDSMIATNDLTQQEAESLYRPIVREAREQQLKHDLLKKKESEGYDAAYKDLAELERPDEFTADEFDAFKANAATTLSRDKAIEEASRKVASEQEAETVQDYISLISMGGSPDSALTSQVNNIIAGDADLTESVNLARSVASFSLGSGAQRQNDLALSEAKALKGEDVAVYQAQLASQAAISKAVERDPLAFASSQGLIDLEPIDMQSPNFMSKRIEQAEMMSQHYGAPVPPLTDREISDLAARIPGMTVNEKISLAEMIAPAIDNKRDPRAQLPGLLSEKNQQIFAQVAAIGDRDIQRAVFDGQEALDGGTFKLPSNTDYLPIFEDYVGDVYGADDKASTMKAVLAHYAGTTIPGEVFSSSDFKESLIAVAGNIDSVNGFKTYIPRVAGGEGQFQSFVDNIDAEYMSIHFPGAAAQDAANKVHKGMLRSVEENLYEVLVEGNQVLVKPNGDPLQISYDPKVAEVLLSRKLARDFEETQQRQAVFDRGSKFFSGVEREEDLLTIPTSKRFTKMDEPIFGDPESKPSQQGIGSAPEGTVDSLRARLQSLKDDDKDPSAYLKRLERSMADSGYSEDFIARFLSKVEP